MSETDLTRQHAEIQLAHDMIKQDGHDWYRSDETIQQLALRFAKVAALLLDREQLRVLDKRWHMIEKSSFNKMFDKKSINHATNVETIIDFVAPSTQDTMVCRTCGGVVYNIARHIDWHQRE